MRPEQWLYGRDLLEHWGCNDLTLKQYILDGLPAYNPSSFQRMIFTSPDSFFITRRRLKYMNQYFADRAGDRLYEEFQEPIPVAELAFKLSEVKKF